MCAWCGHPYCRNPLTGLCGLQPLRVVQGRVRLEGLESQSPYGAMWFATETFKASGTTYTALSQSPYGAMWFATGLRFGRHRGGGWRVAIPLRGYVVCNWRGHHHRPQLPRVVAIPLRGYVVCNMCVIAVSPAGQKVVAIPLRGYVVCNPPPLPLGRGLRPLVAIPLRGYVVCNLGCGGTNGT